MASLTFERVLDAPKIAIDHGGAGELLIFMHGIGGNRTNWADQLTLFSDSFHAVAWDARGYGESDDYDGPLDFGDFAADLRKLIDHFGVDRAHLCGLSMGGRIAQDFYARHPDRVATLSLVATFHGFQNFTDEERQRFVDLRKKPLLEGKEPKDIAPVVAKTLIGPNASDAQFERLVASMAALHKESYIKTVEATTYYNRTADLDKIRVPTLLVYGEHDSLTRPELGKEMQAHIKGSEMVVIDDSGHLINLEQPAAFNRALSAFLDKHKGAAA